MDNTLILVLTLIFAAIGIIYLIVFFCENGDDIVFDFRDKPNDLAHKKAAEALSEFGRVIRNKVTPEMIAEIEREEEIEEYKKLAMFGERNDNNS